MRGLLVQFDAGDGGSRRLDGRHSAGRVGARGHRRRRSSSDRSPARHSTRLGVIRALKGEDVTARAVAAQGPHRRAAGAVHDACWSPRPSSRQTLSKLRLVDPGFERERVLIASTAPSGYTPERRSAFYTRLLEDVAAIPGVVSAGSGESTSLWTSAPAGLCRSGATATETPSNRLCIRCVLSHTAISGRCAFPSFEAATSTPLRGASTTPNRGDRGTRTLPG